MDKKERKEFEAVLKDCEKILETNKAKHDEKMMLGDLDFTGWEFWDLKPSKRNGSKKR